MFILVIISLSIGIFSFIVLVFMANRIVEMEEFLLSKMSQERRCNDDKIKDIANSLNNIEKEIFVANFFYKKLSKHDELILKSEAVSFTATNYFGYKFTAYVHQDEQIKFASIIKSYLK